MIEEAAGAGADNVKFQKRDNEYLVIVLQSSMTT